MNQNHWQIYLKSPFFDSFVWVVYFNSIRNSLLRNMTAGEKMNEATTQRFLRIANIAQKPLEFLASIAGYDLSKLLIVVAGTEPVRAFYCD